MKRALPLSTRTFLVSFLPVSLVLAGGLLTLQTAVDRQARDGVRQLLRALGESQQALRADYGQRNRRLAASLSENAGLKAGISLLREGAGGLARATVEDQLRDLWSSLDYDLLVVTDHRGRLVAGLVRENRLPAPLRSAEVSTPDSAIVTLRGQLYEVTTAPVNLETENIGAITAGKVFDISQRAGGEHAVLFRNGRVVRSSFPARDTAELNRGMNASCAGAGQECELRVHGESFLGFALDLDDGHRLFTMQSLDASAEQFRADLLRIFSALGAGSLIAVLVLSAIGSRSIAKPLTRLIARLHQAERTGELPSGFAANSGTREVNQLALAFNRAAAAVAESQRHLSEAHLEFVETMARTLDARDHYTAGHSDRVADYSTAIARAMQLPERRIETIRLGAQLHDIGKIGVPDAVLLKPGKLTAEEFNLIRLHPQIGCRILEKVGRFGHILPIVELHHEDHDGGGYPYGYSGEAIPLEARIVHVADAYDAMTSDRPYRRGMPVAKTLEILAECAGRQFDPEVTNALIEIMHQKDRAMEEEYVVA